MTRITVLTDPAFDASRDLLDVFFTGAESCFLGNYGYASDRVVLSVRATATHLQSLLIEEFLL